MSEMHSPSQGLPTLAQVTVEQRNEEDRRVLALVLEALASGPPVPVDAAFFAELDAIIASP